MEPCVENLGLLPECWPTLGLPESVGLFSEWSQRVFLEWCQYYPKFWPAFSIFQCVVLVCFFSVVWCAVRQFVCRVLRTPQYCAFWFRGANCSFLLLYVRVFIFQGTYGCIFCYISFCSSLFESFKHLSIIEK